MSGVFPDEQPPPKTCNNCERMEFKIKCGGKHFSERCYGCGLECNCEDDYKWLEASPIPVQTNTSPIPVPVAPPSTIYVDVHI